MNLKILDNNTRLAYVLHERTWNKCRRCRIGKLAIKHVLVRGTLPCEVLFVGEAPGRTENVLGEPFVGRSGKLLDQMIKDSGTVKTYAVTNIVACRPCNAADAENRAPNEEEIKNCKPRFDEILAISNTTLVVALGKTVLENFQVNGIQTLTIYHPSYVLRNGGLASKVYKDCVALLREFLK